MNNNIIVLYATKSVAAIVCQAKVAKFALATFVRTPS
jgi:hypothetical protein